MCDGVSEATIAAMAISTAAAAASAAQQAQNARRQSEAAQSAYDSEVVQTKNQQVQVGQASAAQQSDRARQALVETGHLQALANESGTAGGSDDRVTNEADFNAGSDIATIQANTASQQRQLINNLNGSYATAEQRDASIVNPSLIGTGLQIAASTTSQYTAGQYAKQRASGGVPNVQTTQ